MFIIRETNGEIKKQDSLEIPKVFNAAPAILDEDDDWGLEEETEREEKVEEPSILTSALGNTPENETKDETFSVSAYMNTTQDEPLQPEAIISEHDLPKIRNKKVRRH